MYNQPINSWVCSKIEVCDVEIIRKRHTVSVSACISHGMCVWWCVCEVIILVGFIRFSFEKISSHFSCVPCGEQYTKQRCSCVRIFYSFYFFARKGSYFIMMYPCIFHLTVFNISFSFLSSFRFLRFFSWISWYFIQNY